jgi:hypothetical protein
VLDEGLSIADWSSSTERTSFFALPLSMQAYQELQQVNQILDGLTINHDI